MGKSFDLYKQAFHEWNKDRVPMISAALSYYTLFSIAPLFLIVLSIAGLFFGKSLVQEQMINQATVFFGNQTGEVVRNLVYQTTDPSHSIVASVIGVLIILYGASNMFVILKDALNIIFCVKQEERTDFWTLLQKQTTSVLLIFFLGLLLLVSLIISAALTFITHYFDNLLPIPGEILLVMNNLLYVAIIAALLSSVYLILPDRKLSWNQVWSTSIFISLMFTLGKEIISFYISWVITGSSYGAAGAVIIILLWVYYSSQLLLYGAEVIKCRYNLNKPS